MLQVLEQRDAPTDAADLPAFWRGLPARAAELAPAILTILRFARQHS